MSELEVPAIVRATDVVAAKPKRHRRRAGEGLAALGFLLPNLVGVLLFVALPFGLSLAMAFTDWDLKRHNRFLDHSVQFVGLRNFRDLFAEGQFARFLGNTVFMMLNIPLCMAGSLAAAMLLLRDARPGRSMRRLLWIAAGVGAIVGAALLAMAGLGATAMTLLLAGAFGATLLGGLVGGTTFYRTLFYTPHFVSGVATFILWKKLYNPQGGPINAALAPALDAIAAGTRAVPAPALLAASLAISAVGLLLVWRVASRVRRLWLDGELGTVSALVAATLVLSGLVAMTMTAAHAAIAAATAGLGAAIVFGQAVRALRDRERFAAPMVEGVGTGIVIGALAMIGLALLGVAAAIAWRLPAWGADGLAPPRWLSDVVWAKPALMLMGFWASIGSNSMLLYLAALTNVSPDLYEAADLDGVTPVQRFYHVTWPQLAPTTFFIFVMAVIGGLQGGFESARVMTRGGPAGSTTTLSYFIYSEGFATGRLGFASAVAWTLFAMILAVTLLNWRFGNRYAND